MRQGVFQLLRIEDISGVAGTGVVACGFVASNDKACMFWMVKGKPNTVVTADTFEDLTVHLHDGKTLVQWVWAEECSDSGGKRYAKTKRRSMEFIQAKSLFDRRDHQFRC